MSKTYLDYAATTPLRKEVLDTMSETSLEFWGNPSSQYASGRSARAELESARRRIAECLAVNPKGVTFTSGATEANNLIIRSNAYRLRNEGKGNHLITGDAEHPSVYEVFKSLEKEGFVVSYLPLYKSGTYLVEDLVEALNDKTTLVSLMTVNNETGVIMPVQEIAALLREKEIFFHTDYVQAAGKIDLNAGDIQADAFSITAHKIYGPKGIGLAYQDPSINLQALQLGGHQENSHRAGTESLALASAFAKAIELAQAERLDNEAKLEELSNYLFAQLNSANVEYELNATAKKYVGVHNIHFKGIKSSQALIRLDMAGVEVSAGSACAAGALEPSRVLVSMFGAEDPRVDESLRLSLGIYNNKEDIDKFVEVIASLA